MAVAAKANLDVLSGNYMQSAPLVLTASDIKAILDLLCTIYPAYEMIGYDSTTNTFFTGTKF